MKLRLDLHTHVWEASGFQLPTRAKVEEVLRILKARGLHGLAITDHHHREYALEFRDIVRRYYPGQALVLPGWEIEMRPAADYFNEVQFCEIELLDGLVFRSYCHPGYPGRNIIVEDGIGAIEEDNPLHNWHINKPQVREAAERYGLLLLQVSDAHRLEDIGRVSTEVDLDELLRRAKPARWRPDLTTTPPEGE